MKLSRSIMGAAALAVLASGAPAAALPPDSFMSDVPAPMVACPGGDMTMRIIIRDFAGNLLGGHRVTLDFCNCPGVRLAEGGTHPYTVDPSGCSIWMMTDGFGEARFPIAAGGTCADFPVTVEGWNGTFVERALASVDQDGNGFVNANDRVLVEARLGTADSTADFDGDGVVTAADLAILDEHQGHGWGPLAVPVAAVGGDLRFAAPPSPNPARGRIRFTIANPREQDVDLAVFDLGGRRLATLWSGRLDPGERSFGWDGITRDGARAAAGLYAVRLRGASAVTARLFTLLR